MSDINEMDFITLAKTANAQLPGSWNPRREQPEWDRDFTGREEIGSAFKFQTDKMADWFREALKFSEVVKGGFETAEGGVDLAYIGMRARDHIAKGTAQGLDAEPATQDDDEPGYGAYGEEDDNA